MPWLVLAVALALQAPAPTETMAQWWRYSYHNSEQWEFSVTEQDIAASPSWLATADSPPLSPRAAVRSAEQRLRTMFPDAAQWQLGAVGLQRMWLTDVWVYTVDFNPPEQPNFSRTTIEVLGSIKTMTLVVLMDGRAVVPINRGKGHIGNERPN